MSARPSIRIPSVRIPSIRIPSIRIQSIRILTLALLAAAALATQPPVAGAAATPKVRASYTSLLSQLMCTSCHEPLELVNSPQAISEKAFVKTLIDEGLTTQQVLNAMVAQYSVAVLAKPPASGFNLTVYILPPAILVAGTIFLMITLPKWRERARRAAATPLQSRGKELDAAEAKRLDDELARFI